MKARYCFSLPFDKQMTTMEELQQQLEQITIKRHQLEDQLRQEKKEREERSIAKYFEANVELPIVHYDDNVYDSDSARMHRPVSNLRVKTFGILDLSDIDHCRRCDSQIFRCVEMEAFADPFRKILEEIIFAANLENRLSLSNGLGIFYFQRDLWVISCNRIPICVMDVKMPNQASKNWRRWNYGQLFDYMQHIRSFHGVTNVYGIFTTWDEWTIAWLEDSDYSAKATDLDYDIPQNIKLSPATRRVLHISHTYRRTDAKSLATALYALMKKLAKGMDYIENVSLISKSRSYPQVNTNHLTWKVGINAKQLTLGPPEKNARKYYLLCDFGGGADGRVWLACHENHFGVMNLAVIKFLLNREEGAAREVEAEVKRWHKLGMTSVYGSVLASRHAIVMPFGFHFNGDGTALDNRWWLKESIVPIKHFQEFYEETQKVSSAQAMADCITVTAAQKLVHNDIRWRHVALFPELPKKTLWDSLFARPTPELTVKLRPCFIDLTYMDEATTVEEATEIMVTYVKENLGHELHF